jgi:hypothetical protein
MLFVLLENSRRQTDGVRSCASRYAVLDPDMRLSHFADDTSPPMDGCRRALRMLEGGCRFESASGVHDSEGPPYGGPSTCNELSNRIVALVLRRIAGAVLTESRIRDAGPGVELLERRRPVVAPVPVGRVRVPG